MFTKNQTVNKTFPIKLLCEDIKLLFISLSRTLNTINMIIMVLKQLNWLRLIMTPSHFEYYDLLIKVTCCIYL